MAAKRVSLKDLKQKVKTPEKSKKTISITFSDSDSDTDHDSTAAHKKSSSKSKNTPTKKRKVSDLPPEPQTITCQQVKRSARSEFETEELHCLIIEIHENICPKPEDIIALRRKIVVADKSGFLIGFLKFACNDKLEKGDFIYISNFNFSKKYNELVLHDNTFLGGSRFQDIPQEVIDEATEKADLPLLSEFDSIAEILSKDPGITVSTQGQITRTDTTPRFNPVQGKESKYVMDMKIQDATDSIKVTFWDSAAFYSKPQVGDYVRILDGRYNLQRKGSIPVINLNHQDQMIAYEARTTRTFVTVRAISDNKDNDNVVLTIQTSSHKDKLSINRHKLGQLLDLEDEELHVKDVFVELTPIDMYLTKRGIKTKRIEIVYHAAMDVDRRIAKLRADGEEVEEETTKQKEKSEQPSTSKKTEPSYMDE